MKFWTGARDSVSAECFALLHELSLAARMNRPGFFGDLTL